MEFAVLTALFVILTLGAIFFLRTVRLHNLIDWEHRSANWVDGWNRWYCRSYHRLRTQPLQLPETGGVILAANHFSGLDGFIILALSQRPVRFLIAKEEYERFGLQWLFRAAGCIPVAREARPDKAFREAVRVLRQGEVIALFPHGTIHLDSDPPKKLKAGVARLSELSGCPVIPLRIDGIRAKGSVIWGFFLRAHAVVTQYPALTCAPNDTQHSLQRIAQCIEKSSLKG